jgi:AraC-like DNA-binding protein
MDSRAEAFSVAGRFPASPPREFRVDRHYLLYALSGTMQLEAEGRAWTLPPTRAAVIAAGQPIQVLLRTEVEARSVLFDPGFILPPASALTVIEMTPLAREMVKACAAWTDPHEALPAYYRTLFLALAAVVAELALRPSRAVMPLPQSQALIRALELAREGLAGSLHFETIAAAVAMTPRSLARRLRAEMAMSWREVVRWMRVIASLDLLASGANVTEAAFAVGYASSSAFNAAFREVMGETPSDYKAAVGRLAR